MRAGFRTQSNDLGNASRCFRTKRLGRHWHENSILFHIQYQKLSKWYFVHCVKLTFTENVLLCCIQFLKTLLKTYKCKHNAKHIVNNNGL